MVRRDEISEKTGLLMPVNKRNGRTRAANIALANALRGTQ